MQLKQIDYQPIKNTKISTKTANYPKFHKGLKRFAHVHKFAIPFLGNVF